MTITVNEARNEYTSNAGQAIFSYTFKIFSITDLNVYITPAGQDANDSTDLTTAYTVLGVGDEDGGTITLTVGANLNDLVTIVSNVPSSRTIDYQNNGDFRPDVVNSDFDRVVSIAKKVEDLSGRALLLQQSQQGPKPLTLPAPSSGELLRWKADLTGLENVEIVNLDAAIITLFGRDLIDSPDAAAGRQVLELGALNPDTLDIAIADATLLVGDLLNVGGRATLNDGGRSFWKVVLTSTVTPNTSTIVVSTGDATLSLVLQVNGPISAISCGVKTVVNSQVFIQEAQNLSELFQVPVVFSGIPQISFNGFIEFEGYLEWHGSGRFDTTVKPLQLTRTLISASNWIQKKNENVALNHFLMQDMGFDGSYSLGGFPAVDNLVSMIRIKPDGVTDTDITYLRCHFKDIPHECTVHSPKVTSLVSSGGKIDGINMLFCSGDVTSLANASRSCNMFKTINGSIDDPGEYLNFPITNVVSFGNTCRGMRSLADFKRGTRHFSHNNSSVVDMTDVASISVDGVKDGTIGPNNSGFQTAAAVDTKNFYEVQGIDVEIMGGVWNADNEVDTVAAVLVTDFIYPAETTGTYTGNQSQRVNIRGFRAENITGHAVRLLNTADCYVEHVNAINCDLDAVSFEFTAKLDAAGDPIVPSGNSANHLKSRACRNTLSSNASNPVTVGLDLENEFGQFEVEIPHDKYEEGAVNVNPNPMLTDFTGGISPLHWPGAAIYAAAGSVIGAPASFVLDDTSAVALHFKTFEKIPCVENDIYYFKLFVQSGTGPSQSVLVQEFTSADGFIASTFIPLNATGTLTEVSKRFKSANATCAYIKVNLLPAGESGGDSASIGTTTFANVRIGRKPF